MKQKLINYLRATRGLRKVSATELEINLGTNERNIRLLVEEIRRDNLLDDCVLVSSDEGYYLTSDADEINKFLNMYLSHAFTRIKNVQGMKKFLTEQQTKSIQTELQF